MKSSEHRNDVIVLGAGIVGTATALQLQRRGRTVTLIDRKPPGEETSFGNAGVIEGGIYVPLAFPRNPLSLLRYATNRQTALHFHWSFLPQVAPWLLALFRNSSERKLRQNGEAISTLTAHAVEEHKALLSKAGALALMRDTGWLKLYRSQAELDADSLQRRIADEQNIAYAILAPDDMREYEPHLQPVFHKAVHWPGVSSVSDPGAVTRSAARLFAEHGGDFVQREAIKIVPEEGAWTVATAEGPLTAREVVVALGPWSMDVLEPLGLRLPFAVKRGYHQHYRAQGNAALSRPVVDTRYGYVLAPMAQGTRLTTGIEFAAAEAPATPVQISRAERAARSLFALAEPIETEPWMGRRPCFPDTLPVIGPAPGHKRLWLNFGHAHLGFTLGPVSGRLLAEMMAGENLLVDPAPFSASRFG